MEVSKARPAGTVEEPARLDPGDGARKSDVGEERIADELKLKLGIRVSPRTVRKYLNRQRPGGGSHDQDWNAFVRNQAKAIVACDFFISITLTFRVLYVFVAMEIGSRRILHCNVTDHPTAEWTVQQFREVLADVHPYRFVIHDHDSIFSPSLDLMLNDFGVRVLKTPVQAPKAMPSANDSLGPSAGSVWNYIIPMNERHLRLILKEFVAYYNRGRPHSALGPGTPEPIQASVPAGGHRHQLPPGHRISSKPVLGGLHHDYRLEKEVAQPGGIIADYNTQHDPPNPHQSHRRRFPIGTDHRALCHTRNRRADHAPP